MYVLYMCERQFESSLFTITRENIVKFWVRTNKKFEFVFYAIILTLTYLVLHAVSCPIFRENQPHP